MRRMYSKTELTTLINSEIDKRKATRIHCLSILGTAEGLPNIEFRVFYGHYPSYHGGVLTPSQVNAILNGAVDSPTSTINILVAYNSKLYSHLSCTKVGDNILFDICVNGEIQSFDISTYSFISVLYDVEDNI